MSSHELRAGTMPGPRPPTPQAAWHQLHRTASDRYRSSGRFAWHFARGKLGRDPVFRALLESGAVPPHARVLDIGCGQGLLASLLAACDAMAAARQWPDAWAPAPMHTRYTGIDLMPRDIARAQQALASLAPPPRLICGDMCSTPFEPCDVVVVLDVLHYVDLAAQDDVLARIRAALAPRGRLLLRVGDLSQRWRSALSRCVDHMVTVVRGHSAPPTSSRTLEQWRAALQALGFTVQALPMSHGTPFANVLLRCELPSGIAP
jgi:SAM-dependent methyltransferase